MCKEFKDMSLTTNTAMLAELQAKIDICNSKPDTLDDLMGKTQKEIRDILVSATQKAQEDVSVAPKKLVTRETPLYTPLK